jgi:hypothetical protein
MISISNMHPERNYEMEKSDDSDRSEIDSHWSDDSSEVRCRCHDFISHELEILDRILIEMVSEIENSFENTILSKLKECFECIDDIIIYAYQFLNQAQAVEMKHFIGFNSMLEEIRQSMMKTLTIINKLRERNLFQLVPLVKDLTLDLDEIKTFVSRTTLGQVKEVLEEYRIKKLHIRRKIENFI